MIPLETDLDSFSERQLQSCVSMRVPRGCRGWHRDRYRDRYVCGARFGPWRRRRAWMLPEWADPASVTYGNRKDHGGRRSAVPLLGDPAGDLCARAQSQLAQDVVDVRLDRALGDDEASGDRFVAQSFGE